MRKNAHRIQFSRYVRIFALRRGPEYSKTERNRFGAFRKGKFGVQKWQLEKLIRRSQF